MMHKLKARRWALLFGAGLLLIALAVSPAWPEGLPRGDALALGFSPERLSRLSQKLKAEVTEGRIPGAVLLVARRGQVAFFQAFGVSDRDGEKAMSRDAVFRIFSMTKPLTAAAALMLVDEGRISPNDPVHKYLPAFKKVKVARFQPGSGGLEIRGLAEPARHMTVLDLMRHTSGLSYWFLPPRALAARYRAAGITSLNQTLAQMCDKLAGLPLAFDPGSRYQYSRSIDVLGRVVEVAGGMPLDQFLAKRLYGPLGMKDSGFVIRPGQAGRLVHFAGANPAIPDPARPQKLLSGGGGSISTAMDYAVFAEMLRRGGEYNGVRLLKPESVKFMTSDQLGPLARRSDPFYVPGPGFGQGCGLYVRISEQDAPYPGGLGEFVKGGYGGTLFWVDPKAELTAVLMMSAPSERKRYRALIKTMIHQALLP